MINKIRLDKLEEEGKLMIKIIDKLEQRISTLEKIIGKLQLRLGDVVLYIDKKGEEKPCPTKKQ